MQAANIPCKIQQLTCPSGFKQDTGSLKQTCDDIKQGGKACYLGCVCAGSKCDNDARLVAQYASCIQKDTEDQRKELLHRVLAFQDKRRERSQELMNGKHSYRNRWKLQLEVDTALRKAMAVIRNDVCPPSGSRRRNNRKRRLSGTRRLLLEASSPVCSESDMENRIPKEERDQLSTTFQAGSCRHYGDVLRESSSGQDLVNRFESNLKDRGISVEAYSPCAIRYKPDKGFKEAYYFRPVHFKVTGKYELDGNDQEYTLMSYGYDGKTKCDNGKEKSKHCEVVPEYYVAISRDEECGKKKCPFISHSLVFTGGLSEDGRRRRRRRRL